MVDVNQPVDHRTSTANVRCTLTDPTISKVVLMSADGPDRYLHITRLSLTLTNMSGILTGTFNTKMATTANSTTIKTTGCLDPRGPLLHRLLEE